MPSRSRGTLRVRRAPSMHFSFSEEDIKRHRLAKSVSVRYNIGRGNHWEKGILPCRAYTLIYRGAQIQYREREPLGEGNPALQSLHSNIQRDTDTIQGEGTIGRRESCPAELTL
uniref:Uncharacterized protein n=1 Tax=Xenopus tropicalis TaxID=8364 RepID=A0A1B8Y220_XENTR